MPAHSARTREIEPQGPGHGALQTIAAPAGEEVGDRLVIDPIGADGNLVLARRLDQAVQGKAALRHLVRRLH